MLDIDQIIGKIDEYQPLQTFTFGHTPLQISHFKTAQQKGHEAFEFWHQVLQLRSLRDSLEELTLQKAELEHEILKGKSLWPFWSYKERKRKIPRLEFQLKKIKRSILEKSREANAHYEILKRDYAHLENMSEEDILSQDKEYWTHRLGRQLAQSRLSRALGVGEGELSAVLALPKEEQMTIFKAMNGSLSSSVFLPK